jgi:hypothetical protein
LESEVSLLVREAGDDQHHSVSVAWGWMHEIIRGRRRAEKNVS